jgi:hypothetical protein
MLLESIVDINRKEVRNRHRGKEALRDNKRKVPILGDREMD